ncbi:MAG: hypothetical protein ACFFE8_05045 [Candidatus Heimdallarchaeota archaeon]
MARVRENLQQSLQTVLAHLPRNFDHYPPTDRLVLEKLLHVLEYYREADFNRKQLAQRMLDLRLEIRASKSYLATPYYWFAETFLKNAHLLLQNSLKYHATEFYGYLLRTLRGAPPIKGIFQLTRNAIPLGDPAWEKLQYESNKQLIFLTDDQLRILEAVYSSIAESGILAMDGNRLSEYLAERATFPSGVSVTQELTRLFSLIDGRWFFHFFTPAFGLDWLFVVFQLKLSTQLTSVIDLSDAKNSTLMASEVFRVNDQPNSYLGLLVVPSRDIETIMTFFYREEKKGSLSIGELSQISNTQRSASFFLYRPKSGWSDPPSTLLNRLTSELTSKELIGPQVKPRSLFIPRPFNTSWDYTQHPLQYQIITLYCKIPATYGFSSLPTLSRYDPASQLTRAEMGLIKQLYFNGVMTPFFVPWHLLSEFSLDLYAIHVPPMSFLLLQRFLNLLPFGRIYYTPDSILVLARLNSPLLHWIKETLNWKVHPIISYYTNVPHSIDWFDAQNNQWVSPEIL